MTTIVAVAKNEPYDDGQRHSHHRNDRAGADTFRDRVELGDRSRVVRDGLRGRATERLLRELRDDSRAHGPHRIDAVSRRARSCSGRRECGDGDWSCIAAFAACCSDE